MILVKRLIQTLKRNKIEFFTGVPDSILKNFSIYVEKFPKRKHVIASNEGLATSLGIGYYLSTKNTMHIFTKLGLSNAINPLISIASKAFILYLYF